MYFKAWYAKILSKRLWARRKLIKNWNKNILIVTAGKPELIEVDIGLMLFIVKCTSIGSLIFHVKLLRTVKNNIVF